MTHEYRIAVGGRIEPSPPGRAPGSATAVAWAADHVLAVGSDDEVRSISRGDSTFLDLAGCVVTIAPSDPAGAAASLRGTGGDVGTELVRGGWLSDGEIVQPGVRADLAFWDAIGSSPRIIAVLAGGTFTAGDERSGPFQPG